MKNIVGRENNETRPLDRKKGLEIKQLRRTNVVENKRKKKCRNCDSGSFLLFQGNFQFHCSFNRSKIWVALRADTVAWQIEMYLSRVTSLAAVVGTEYIDKMRAIV